MIIGKVKICGERGLTILVFPTRGAKIVMCERMPEMLEPQMRNQMYTAKVADFQATQEFIKFVQEKAQ